MNNATFFPLVVADIGGTNARFGIASGEKDQHGRFSITRQKVFQCAEYTTFEDVFAAYLKHISDMTPKYACVAVAGPVISDRVKLTNLSWDFSVEAVRQHFQFDNIKAINDFGAQAYSTLYLQESELITIYPGISNNDNKSELSRTIIGPGTGLGVAGLIKTDDHWLPLCGESGHASFSPLNDMQVKVRDALLTILQKSAPTIKHVSIENLISGPGLVNIYTALCQIDNVEPKPFSPIDISNNAAKRNNEQCVNALSLFCDVLGAAAGDIALTMGAFGGVYLSGGILPKVFEELGDSCMLDSFLNKGVMTDLVKSMPVYLVTAEMHALAGAAHMMVDMLEAEPN